MPIKASVNFDYVEAATAIRIPRAAFLLSGVAAATLKSPAAISASEHDEGRRVTGRKQRGGGNPFSGIKRSYEATDSRAPVGFGVQHPIQETTDGDLDQRPADRRG
jgi:hypothetical protein